MSDQEQRIQDLERKVAALEKFVTPMTWVGEPVWYCSGYKDCCEYEINYISKVDVKRFRVKVKCSHCSEWISLGSFQSLRTNVERWIEDGQKQIADKEN